MARPIERPEHHYKPFEYTINVEDAFDYLDEFKNSPDYPKKGAEMGILYTPNKYQILGDRLEAEFDIDMIEARKIVGNWFKRNNSKKKKVTKLTESDLNRIVKRVINESTQSSNKIFLNADTTTVYVTRRSERDPKGKELIGAKVEWVNNKGIKVTLPKGEMRSDEIFYASIYTNNPKQYIGRSHMFSRWITQFNSNGELERRAEIVNKDKVKVNRKEISVLWTWPKDGITIVQPEAT